MPETDQLATLKKVFHAVASFQAAVLLGLVYYLALAPASLLLKLTGQDALGLKPSSSGWTPRPKVEPADHLKDQG
jgi:hypothetical protein